MTSYKSCIKLISVKNVLFLWAFFMLSACDEQPKDTLSTQKSTLDKANILITPPKTQSKSREILTRAVYSDLVIQPEKIENQEQEVFLRDLFEGLVAYNNSGNIIPAVAESWQTEDNKNWVFILRENAKWSNGEAVTADDFVKSWQALALSDSPLKNYLIFMHIKNAAKIIDNKNIVEKLGVSALDQRILLIELDKPTPYFPSMLAHVSLLPQYQRKSESVVSNGAYIFEKQQDNFIYLLKNPYYWAKENVSFNNVNYKKIINEKISDEIDVLIDPKEKSQQDIHFLPQQCLYFYTFNFSHSPFSHLAVRKALKGMISSKNLIPDGMQPLNSVLPLSLQQENQEPWSYILVEALLKEAGITEKSPLSFSITSDDGENAFNITKRLVQMWSQSDLLKVKINKVSYNELLQKRAKGEFDIIRSGWCSDYKDPSAFLNQFHSQSADNQIGYHNKLVDQLLDKTTEMISPEKRTALYQQIVAELQKDIVILPIFQYTAPHYWHSSISGINIKNDTGVIYSKDLYRKVETKDHINSQ